MTEMKIDSKNKAPFRDKEGRKMPSPQPYEKIKLKLHFRTNLEIVFKQSSQLVHNFIKFRIYLRTMITLMACRTISKVSGGGGELTVKATLA